MVPRGEASTGRKHRLILLLTLALGLVLFVWRLGSTGLVDETPPLFAASAREMAEGGDWLIPWVNGLPRYDKPPLVYWLMGLLYLLPGQEQWNPLGTWAARLPSALASVAVMVGLARILLLMPQPAAPLAGPPPPRSGATAVGAALAFALSPLVMLWGRTAVSDALFSALTALSLLLAWEAYASPRSRWWPCWLVLGLAVLTKGPVAVVLFVLTLLVFAWLQQECRRLLQRLRPVVGLMLTGLVALPWYAAAVFREGRAYWESFFGYHNLQRFATVVNDHRQPWWFFLPVLVVASLPFTPLLLLGLRRAFGPLRRQWFPTVPLPPEHSLARYAACWLLAILVFFTAAATKLPSYWLPATPAAALLIAITAQSPWGGSDHDARLARRAWALTLLVCSLLGLTFLLGLLWLPWIQDPELPTLPSALLASGRLWVAGGCFLLAALAGWKWRRQPPPLRLLAVEFLLLIFVPFVLLPCWQIGDVLRGAPVREMAAALQRESLPGEPVAMVGILKPSLHYYGRRVILYEGNTPEGLVNLADRLRKERRRGQRPASPEAGSSVLTVIDQGTAELPFWRALKPQELGRSGLYRLWRLDRRRLEGRRRELEAEGVRADWQEPRPERY